MFAARARRTPSASLVLSLAAGIIYLSPLLGERLQYDRPGIAAGEVWRILTGHWVHYSLDHFAWDVAAFLVLGLACEQVGRRRFLGCVVASALVISAAVWYWLPGLEIYRGLSGIDSALFGLLFADLWLEGERSDRRGQQWIAAALFGGFVLKISFEFATGVTVFVRDLGPGPVGVPLAHLIGAGVGLLVGVSGAVTTWWRASRGVPAPARLRGGEVC